MNFLLDCRIISRPAHETFYQFGKISLVLLNLKHTTVVLLSSPQIFHCELRKSFAVLFYGNHIMDLVLCIIIVSSTNDCLLFSALRVVLRVVCRQWEIIHTGRLTLRENDDISIRPWWHDFMPSVFFQSIARKLLRHADGFHFHLNSD